jgi:hypothetical protein
MRRRLTDDDSGASLIIVLIFVFVLSVVLGAVVDFGGTSIRATTSVREVRHINYALDGAVGGAINQIRSDLTQGLAPDFTNGVNSCAGFDSPATNGLDVTVSCQGEQGVQGQYDSGSFTPVVNPNNVPPVALQTTANSGEPGIALDANGSYRIHGSVMASSSIRACTNSGWNSCSSGSANSALLVEGRVIAGQCIGDIRTFGPPYPPGTLDSTLKICPGGIPPSVPPYDPGFTSPPGIKMAPACPAGYLVTFTPGTYTDATALNAITNGGCTGKIVWFKPGNYFFNFSNLGTHEWDLADSTSNVVGGTPFGWSPTAPTRPFIPKADNSNPAVHACVTPYDAGGMQPNVGVEFAFTGDSHLSIQPAGGNLELCAQFSDTGQQIALYGMPMRGNIQAGTLGATSVDPSPGFGADLATSGLTIDGLVSTGTTPTGGTATANFAGFDQLDAATLPSSAVVTRVTLKVSHQEGPNNGAISSVVANITAADGTILPSQTLTQCTGAAACADSVDVTRYFPDMTKLRSGTARPKLAYKVTAAAGKVATGTIDGMALDVSWVPKSAYATSVPNPPANVTNPTNAMAVDGATATVTVTSNATTNLTLRGYDQMAAADLPIGAVITSVSAHIVHKESSSSVPTITVGGTAADGTAIIAQPVAACVDTLVNCTQDVPLTTSLNSVSKLRDGAGNGPKLVFAVKGKNSASATSDLDGIRLDITFAPDELGTAQGCVSAAPYAANDNGTCPLFRAQGNNAYVSIHGTIYAPSSAVDLKIMNGGTTIFGRGAIVRTLRLFFNPSVLYSSSNITVQVPEVGSMLRRPRIVDFWACPPNPDGTRVATCDDTNGKLHVVASFDDNSPGTPVTVKLWSRRR